jgi:hypothetical protein
VFLQEHLSILQFSCREVLFSPPEKVAYRYDAERMGLVRNCRSVASGKRLRSERWISCFGNRRGGFILSRRDAAKEYSPWRKPWVGAKMNPGPGGAKETLRGNPDCPWN